MRGFWQAAREDPERPALVLPDGSRKSAGEVLSACNRVVHGLRGLGCGPGASVAVALPNGAPILEVLMAAMQAGWYFTPINTNLAVPEVAWILRDCGARAFVADSSLAEKAAAAADAAGLDPRGRFAVGGAPGFRAFEELSAAGPDGAPEGRQAGQLMLYTSGTTGRPRGIRRAIAPADPDRVATLYASHLMQFGIQPGPGDVHLCTSPMYHTAPLAFSYFSLHFGHRVVLMERWDAERVLQRIESEGVTTTHMVPTQFHRLLLLPEGVRRRYDTSSLRRVLHAAAPCPVELKRRMLEWWGPVIWEYYGATEGGGTLVGPEEWLARPGTVGRAWAGAEIRVLDDDGRPCPPGQPGTVYMKLVQDFEYKGDAEKTRSARQGDFFTVGDVGYLDAEGYLFLCDRKIDMIISGGVNIYPAEVEAVLLGHPKVGDAAVFGIPDEDWGEQVKAVVEAAPGVEADATLERELRAHLEGRLARYKVPRSIDFADTLPRDPNGKLYKRVLRDPWWTGRERKI